MPLEGRWDVKGDDENGFFLIRCSVAFLQQFLSHENSPGRTLSILVPTCNKKVVQSLNYLFKLLTILLPPYRGLSASPEPCQHRLCQQPGASLRCRRGICHGSGRAAWERLGVLGASFCRAAGGEPDGTCAPAPRVQPPQDSLLLPWGFRCTRGTDTLPGPNRGALCPLCPGRRSRFTQAEGWEPCPGSSPCSCLPGVPLLRFQRAHRTEHPGPPSYRNRC